MHLLEVSQTLCQNRLPTDPSILNMYCIQYSTVQHVLEYTMHTMRPPDVGMVLYSYTSQQLQYSFPTPRDRLKSHFYRVPTKEFVIELSKLSRCPRRYPFASARDAWDILMQHVRKGTSEMKIKFPDNELWGMLYRVQILQEDCPFEKGQRVTLCSQEHNEFRVEVSG